MIISINTEKAFDKFKHFPDENIEKTRNNREISQSNKCYYETEKGHLS